MVKFWEEDEFAAAIKQVFGHFIHKKEWFDEYVYSPKMYVKFKVNLNDCKKLLDLIDKLKITCTMRILHYGFEAYEITIDKYELQKRYGKNE